MAYGRVPAVGVVEGIDLVFNFLPNVAAGFVNNALNQFSSDGSE